MGGFFSSLFGLGSEEVSSDDVEPTPPPKPVENTDEEKEEVEPKPDERPAEDEGDEDSFALQLLDAQNEYRLTHGAEPLSLSEGMNQEAQKWADHLAQSGNLQHGDTDDGENLAFASPTLNAKQAADMWYKEIKDYDFSNPRFTGGTGHFTQLVWLGSKQFGAGVAKGASGIFVVGRYRPAGNITNEGQFQANVLPAK